ncbi:MAG TPA: AAA family ATPase [bacterium]
MSTILACPYCGFANQLGAKFCANCGRPVASRCPECGADVASGARFCSNCGILLAGRARTETGVSPEVPAEARKVVTVLFADLAGSTALTQRLDPEEARQVVGRFYDVVQHVVERWFAGSVANYLGDGVLAVFGLPAAHEDDPERAVRAGLAIRDAMPVLNAHLGSTFGVQLAVRVGIDTGEVVAATGSTFDRDFLISDAVTTAARLQQTVSAGTVVVGERTYRLTSQSIEYTDLPPMLVKGKDDAIRVWAAVRALPETSDVRRIAAPLVGRHGELALLRHLYQRTHDEGRLHLVTLMGQPGIGKSRLLREFLAELRETIPTPLVLRGRSVAFGQQIGYHALLDILRAQAGLMDTDAPEVVREKLAGWLRGVLPAENALLDGLQLTFGGEPAGADPGEIRRKLFEAWIGLVSSLAATRPVVLAFEDLHWADEGVLDLIEMLGDRARSAPIFVICIARPEILERRQSWGGGRRNATTIDLPPLRATEVEQLVASLGSQGLAADVLQTIARRAEGNPLFVEELVRMIMEGSVPGTQIPDTVQAVITARIDRLPVPERRALQTAAVIGRTFWPSAVAALAGQHPDETTTILGSLVGKELIVERPASTIAGEREYAFRHILTRDVAYNLLPRTHRQPAHAQIARWLEGRLGERVEEVIEVLAEHLRVAGDERAAAYLHRAGNKARRQYANADALRLFDQALEAAGAVHGDPNLIGAIHRDRGDVRQLTGEYAGAMEAYDAGLREAQRADAGELEAALENRVGVIYHRQMNLEEAERHFRRSADVARAAGARAALGQTLVDLANIAWDHGAMPPDHPALQEGLALLRAAGDQAGVARAVNLLCMGYVGAGLGEEALAAAAEGVNAARDAGDRSREATSLSYLCVINGFLGRYRIALEHGSDALRIAEQIGDRRRAAYTRFFMGRIQTSFGMWPEALANLEMARGMTKGLARIQYPWLYYFSGLAYQLTGSLEEAAVMWRAGAEVESRSPAWRQISLASSIELAQHEGNERALQEALDEVIRLPGGSFVPSDVEVVLLIGETLLDAGRLDDLAAFVASRRPGIERFGSFPGLASLAMLDARLATRDGDVTRADELLARAVRWSDEAEDAHRRWRARELRAELLGQQDDRAALRQFLSETAARLPEDLRARFLSSTRVAAALN